MVQLYSQAEKFLTIFKDVCMDVSIHILENTLEIMPFFTYSRLWYGLLAVVCNVLAHFSRTFRHEKTRIEKL